MTRTPQQRLDKRAERMEEALLDLIQHSAAGETAGSQWDKKRWRLQLLAYARRYATAVRTLGRQIPS